MTAKELSSDYTIGKVIVADDYTPITDISIVYDGIVIFVEVKKYSEDCRKQLEEQITKCKTALAKDRPDSFSDPQVDIISITWTDIVKILERYMNYKGSGVERLIRDYYYNITWHYPSWSPDELISKLSSLDDPRIPKRLNSIKCEYAKKYDTDLIFNRQAIQLNMEYASECDLFYVDKLYTHNRIEEPCIVIAIWPADTCGQFWALKNICEDLQFASKRYKEVKLKDNEFFHVRILPYIKFCHFNRGIYNLYMDEHDDDNHIEDLKSLAEKITRKWSREPDNYWTECIRFIRESGIFSKQKINELEQKFNECFICSNRNYLVSSIGFEVYLYMSFEQAKAIDMMKDDTSGFVPLIKDYLDKLDSFIRLKSGLE